ncbi:Lin0512 family protein [Aestuariivirga sp.]|uniref:Lin0512 family protein n=1 Tax=Aestuariivirga sp. TaxID=2650926 RepID=UPI003593A496
MAKKRIILELGHGNDMHGGDYTKAALRAVQDCIHHSSLPFFRTLDINRDDTEIEVTIGVQQPDKVDKTAVAASLPFGHVTVNVVKGGLDVADKERGGGAVIATAGVAVRLDLEAHLGIT